MDEAKMEDDPTTTTTTTTTTSPTSATTTSTTPTTAASAPPINAFALLVAGMAGMVKQNKADAKEKERETRKKPRGRCPKHYKEWDPIEGKWLEDPDDPPPKIDKFPKPAHRPPAGKVWDGEVGDWVDDHSSTVEADSKEDDDVSSDEDDGDGATSTTKKSPRRSYARTFNSGWQKHLPWLVCVSVLVALPIMLKWKS
jgi:hypothetical protein